MCTIIFINKSKNTETFINLSKLVLYKSYISPKRFMFRVILMRKRQIFVLSTIIMLILVLLIFSLAGSVADQRGGRPANNPPGIVIAHPTGGSSVKGNVTIWMNAWDADGSSQIQDVWVKIDGGSLINATYNHTDKEGQWWYYIWDTTLLSNGWHSITAVVFDGIDDAHNLKEYNVNNEGANNAPGIVITHPKDGDTVKGTVRIWMNAWDKDNISDIKHVWVQIDGGAKINATYNHTDKEGQWWYYDLNTSGLSEGWHVVKAIVYDGQDDGHDVIELNVDNIPDNNAPGIVITHPKGGATVKGTVRIWMNAWDKDNISDIKHVWVQIDGGAKINATYNHTDKEGQWWYYDWNTTGLEDGWHKIKAIVYDGIDDGHDLKEYNVDNIQQNNAPGIVITHPKDGATVKGTVRIWMNAWDKDNISDIKHVWVQIDGGAKLNATYNHTDKEGQWWYYDLNTSGLSEGWHVVKAIVHDGVDDGHDAVEYYVDNVQDNNAPGIVIVKPKDGAEVNGTVTIWMNAWDKDNISDIKHVWVQIDGGAKLNATYNHTDKEGQWWYYVWNTTGLEDGWHKIKAIAYDGQDDGHDLNEIYVDNDKNTKPLVYISYPSEEWAEVNGTVKIKGYAGDKDEGDKVELVQITFNSEKGPWFNATDTSGNNTWWTWEYDWNTTEYENGKHKILARSWDGSLYSDLTDAHVIVNNSESKNYGPMEEKDDDEDDGGGLPGFEPVLLAAAVGIGVVVASFRGRYRRRQI
jgi:major membrane immunogen (membrane-anchored lipoprotein)